MTHSNPASEPLFRESVNTRVSQGSFQEPWGEGAHLMPMLEGDPLALAVDVHVGLPQNASPPLGPATAVAVSIPGQFCDAVYCPACLSQLTVSTLWIFIALLQGTHSHLHNLGRRLNLYSRHPKPKGLFFSHVRHKQPNLNFTTN